MTRSFILCARFDWFEALKLNAAGACLFAAIIVSIPWRLTQLVNFYFFMGKPPRYTTGLGEKWLLVIGVIMIFQWIVKLFFGTS